MKPKKKAVPRSRGGGSESDEGDESEGGADEESDDAGEGESDSDGDVLEAADVEEEPENVTAAAASSKGVVAAVATPQIRDALQLLGMSALEK